MSKIFFDNGISLDGFLPVKTGVLKTLLDTRSRHTPMDV